MLIRGRVSVMCAVRDMRVCLHGSWIQRRLRYLFGNLISLFVASSTMAAIIPTQRAPKSLEDLKYHLNRDNKVKVAGRVIMCLLRPILTHLVTQGSMVGFDLTF